MPIPCRSCTYKAADFADLAKHITASKKGHRKGKRWAASYLLKVNILNSKRGLPSRTPMTEEEQDALREARAEIKRELSGETRLAGTVCPKCKRASSQAIPIEYVNSERAWRTQNGTLIILCVNCRVK